VSGELPPWGRVVAAVYHFPDDVEVVGVELGPGVHGDEAELGGLGAPALAAEGTDDEVRGPEKGARKEGQEGRRYKA